VRNPQASKSLIEKLGIQPTVLLNDVIEHMYRVDAMLNSKKQPTLTLLMKMQGKQKVGSSHGSSDRSCYVCGKVGHSARTCRNKEKVLAVCIEKESANDKKDSDEKEKENVEKRCGSHNGARKASTEAEVEKNMRASV
jgi:hypothetical protein